MGNIPPSIQQKHPFLTTFQQIPPFESTSKTRKMYIQLYIQPYIQQQNRPKTKSPSWIYIYIKLRHLMEICHIAKEKAQPREHT